MNFECPGCGYPYTSKLAAEECWAFDVADDRKLRRVNKSPDPGNRPADWDLRSSHGATTDGSYI